MKENFQPNNIEPKKEDISHEKRLNLAKNARRILLATGVAMSALFPNKTEAQKVKEREPIVVHDKKDSRLKAYNDSMNLYNVSKYETDEILKLSKGDENKVLDTEVSKIRSEIEASGKFNHFFKSFKNLKELNKKEPKPVKIIPITPIDEFNNTVRVGESLHVFKKPVQEVIYKTKKIELPINVAIPLTVENYSEALKKYKYPDVGDILKGLKEGKTVNDKFFELFLNADGTLSSISYYEKDPYVAEIKDGKESLPPVPMGTFNIQGREVSYYSEEQKNSILTILKDHNITATQVGDSDNYTVSRFNEKTDGWDGNELKFKDGGSVVF